VKVALATAQELPQLSEDDRALLPELDQRGISAEPTVWSDPSVDWSAFDAVVIRSTWGYYRRLAEYLTWADTIGSGSALWNPPTVVRWNSHKSYLLDLEARGVSIVPTRLCRTLPEAFEVAGQERWDRAVVKPAVSAGGYLTHLLDRGVQVPDAPPWTDLARAGELLVQPYQVEVGLTGERSLVFFLGTYSHAFLRSPHLVPNDDLVEGAPVVPSSEELRVAQRALAAAPGRTLYGRVDLVTDGGGRPRVMELEVIEPFLGLRTARGAARAFALAVSSVLGSPPG